MYFLVYFFTRVFHAYISRVKNLCAIWWICIQETSVMLQFRGLKVYKVTQVTGTSLCIEAW